jgi:hypothetical protein
MSEAKSSSFGITEAFLPDLVERTVYSAASRPVQQRSNSLAETQNGLAVEDARPATAESFSGSREHGHHGVRVVAHYN